MLEPEAAETLAVTCADTLAEPKCKILLALMQASERIPYETLLKQRQSSSSVPPTQSKGRPSWSTLESQPNPSAWHESLNSRSLQNSPHRPALPRPRAAHAEEEDWPDLTQLKWEGGVTGVVRGRQDGPVDFRELRQNAVKTAYSGQALDGQVLTKMMDGKRGNQHNRLSHSVSLANRSRWGSPSAKPFGPQGRAVARSTSRARQQQQQLESHDSLRQMTQPLHTHISLDSLMISPTPAAADRTERFRTSQDGFVAQALIRDELDHDQLSQHDCQAPGLHKDDRLRQAQCSHQGTWVSGNSHTNVGGDIRGVKRGSRGGPSQQVPPQQPALHEWGVDSAKESNKEEDGAASTAARAMPNFASPTRSSEAKAQHAQHSLNAFPSTRSRSRQSAGSNCEAGTHLLRKHSEDSHQAITRGDVNVAGEQTPGNGGHTLGSVGQNPGIGGQPFGNGGKTSASEEQTPGDAAPLTSTFRSVCNWLHPTGI